jgi:hypothetical protein
LCTERQQNSKKYVCNIVYGLAVTNIEMILLELSVISDKLNVHRILSVLSELIFQEKIISLK